MLRPLSPLLYSSGDKSSSGGGSSFPRPLVTLGLVLTALFALSSHLQGSSSSSSSTRHGSQSSGRTSALSRSKSSPPNDVLVMYSYTQTPETLTNFRFLLDHGLHSKADWIFIVNGYSNVRIPQRDNVRVVYRTNKCNSLAAYAETFTSDPDLISRYSRFIFITSSVRGPFLPTWNSECWTDTLARRINSKVKLAGITTSCLDYHDLGALHIQSDLLVTDKTGLELMLRKELWDQCPDTIQGDMDATIDSTAAIYQSGFEADALFRQWLGDKDAIDTCEHGSPWVPENNHGIQIHPFETMFVKAGEDYDEEEMIERYTKWADMEGLSGDTFCR